MLQIKKKKKIPTIFDYTVFLTITTILPQFLNRGEIID